MKINMQNKELQHILLNILTWAWWYENSPWIFPDKKIETKLSGT